MEKTIQKDINKEIHIWSTSTLKNNYDDSIPERHELLPNIWIVMRRKDKEQVDVTKQEMKDGLIKSSKEDDESREVPLHLGSFILAHSKRIMNNFIITINGFKFCVVYYSDTDSLYIPKALYEILNKNGLVGDDLTKGKNDYGEGGIIFGLYIAPKIKYNIILCDGILTEKKTFKGNNKDKVQSKNFFDLITGQVVVTESTKPWKKDFENGVRLPDPKLFEKDKLIKRFAHDINILKRREPDENGIMYPYYITNYTLTKSNKPIVDLSDENNDKFWESISKEDSLFQYENEKEYQENIDTYIENVNEENADEIVPLNKDNIFEECTKCKEVKCITEFSNPSWCKICMKRVNKNG